MEPEAPGRRPRRRSARPAAQPGRDVAGLAEIARGSTLNLAGAAISAAATVGVTVLVTRQFTRPVAGAFFTATSLFLIVEAIAGLGAYSGVVYFIARLWSLGAESRIPIMLRAAIVPVVVSSVGAAVLLLAFADPLARALLDGRSFSGAAAPSAVADALRALAAALPFAALLDTFLGAGRGYRDMRPTVVVDRIGRSCLQLLGVLAAALTGTAALLAPLWALSYIPAAAAAWLWLRRIRLQHPERAAVRPGFATLPPVAVAETPSDEGSERTEQPGDSTLANANPRGFWLFTAPRAVATVAQMVIQRLDIVLVGIIRGPVEAAIYTAATRFLVVGQLGNAAISMAAQPQLSHLFARHDRRGANTVYQATTAWLIILTWPLYLLAVVYGPEVLTVFGHSYRAGATVMVILGLTMLLGTACGQVDMVLTTTGRSGWSLANGLLACSVNVVVDLALRNHWRGDRLGRRDHSGQPGAADPARLDRSCAPLRDGNPSRLRAVRAELRRHPGSGARRARWRRSGIGRDRRRRLRGARCGSLALPRAAAVVSDTGTLLPWRQAGRSGATARRTGGWNRAEMIGSWV